MERGIIAALLVTNLAAGLGCFYFYDLHRAATATQTTDAERLTYGLACVEWVNNFMTEKGMPKESVYMGRSWKKYGQLVFEINPNDEFNHALIPSPIRPYVWPGMLCTYDVQSGMMHSVEGAARKEWMFF